MISKVRIKKLEKTISKNSKRINGVYFEDDTLNEFERKIKLQDYVKCSLPRDVIQLEFIEVETGEKEVINLQELFK